jgi:hypothetical protein
MKDNPNEFILRSVQNQTPKKGELSNHNLKSSKTKSKANASSAFQNLMGVPLFFVKIEVSF